MIWNFGAVHSVTVPHGVTTVGFVDGSGTSRSPGRAGASARHSTQRRPSRSPRRCRLSAPRPRPRSSPCGSYRTCAPSVRVVGPNPARRRVSAQRNVFGASRIRITRAGTPPTTALSGTSLVRPPRWCRSRRCRRPSRRAGCRRRSRSRRCGRRGRRACRCPAARIGRSTSTTPWSKSISITRSATMHSRPIETCWKAEIVHSWPSTVLAPIATSPSCARILQPWPIHDQRPRSTVAPRPISNLTPGQTKHSPSVCRRPRQRSFSHSQRASSARVAQRAASGCARAKRRNVERPAVQRRRAGSDERRDRRRRRSRGSSGSVRTARHAQDRTPAGMIAPRPWPTRDDTSPSACSTGDKRALARGDHAGRERRPGRLGARPRGLPAHRHGPRSSGFTGPPGAGKSTLLGALTKLERARGPHRRRAVDRPVLAVHPGRAARRPDPADRPLPRPGRVHPLDGQPRRARRAQRGGAAGGAADGRRRQGRGAARDGRRRPGRGRHHRPRRHRRARADARLGRLDPGAEGRRDGDPGRDRRQQGRPPADRHDGPRDQGRARARAAAAAGRCRSSRPRRSAARASRSWSSKLDEHRALHRGGGHAAPSAAAATCATRCSRSRRSGCAASSRRRSPRTREVQELLDRGRRRASSIRPARPRTILEREPSSAPPSAEPMSELDRRSFLTRAAASWPGSAGGRVGPCREAGAAAARPRRRSPL